MFVQRPLLQDAPRAQVFLRRRNHRGISHLEPCCLPRHTHLRHGRRACHSRSHDMSHPVLPATGRRALETGCSSPGWFAQSGASCPARVLLLSTMVVRTAENLQPQPGFGNNGLSHRHPPPPAGTRPGGKSVFVESWVEPSSWRLQLKIQPALAEFPSRWETYIRLSWNRSQECSHTQISLNLARCFRTQS